MWTGSRKTELGGPFFKEKGPLGIVDRGPESC